MSNNANARVRQSKIFEHLKVVGSESVTVLAQMFGVSEMTIRRDLDALERASLIVRQHGKALLVKTETLSVGFAERAGKNYKVKCAIAQRAIPLLENAKTLYVDGSSTAFCLLQFLPRDCVYTIFTNSYAVFKEISVMPNIQSFIIGGFLTDDNNTIDDESSREMAKHIFVDLAFYSCYGFSYDGLFNNAYLGTEVKRIVLQNAEKSVLLADSSKVLKRGIYLFSTWASVSYLITDSPLPDSLAGSIRAAGTDVIDR